MVDDKASLTLSAPRRVAFRANVVTGQAGTLPQQRRDSRPTINLPRSHQSSAITARDVEVTRIPSGEKITLPTGTQVVITQALGGSFTILVPSQAGLYRIEGQDADSIGQGSLPALEKPVDGNLEQAAWDQLK